MIILLKLILLWVQLLVFVKICKSFMKKESTNYSNTLKKLAKYRKVSPQIVYKSVTIGLQHTLTLIAWIPVCFQRTCKNCFPRFLGLSETLLSPGQAYSLINISQISRKNNTLWSNSHAEVWRGHTSSHWHARNSTLDSQLYAGGR